MHMPANGTNNFISMPFGAIDPIGLHISFAIWKWLKRDGEGHDGGRL